MKGTRFKCPNCNAGTENMVVLPRFKKGVVIDSDLCVA